MYIFLPSYLFLSRPVHSLVTRSEPLNHYNTSQSIVAFDDKKLSYRREAARRCMSRENVVKSILVSMAIHGNSLRKASRGFYATAFLFAVSIHLTLKNIVTLKSKPRATQGHWKWHHSIDRIRVPIRHYTITAALSCIISEIKQDIGRNPRSFSYRTCNRHPVKGTPPEFCHNISN